MLVWGVKVSAFGVFWVSKKTKARPRCIGPGSCSYLGLGPACGFGFSRFQLWAEMSWLQGKGCTTFKELGRGTSRPAQTQPPPYSTYTHTTGRPLPSDLPITATSQENETVKLWSRKGTKIGPVDLQKRPEIIETIYEHKQIYLCFLHR